jgi:predicted TIM-barrel fold metal-dependent hydrolase
MRIIDAHNHPDWHGHGFDRVIGDMDAQGIAQTWLLTWECPGDEYDHRADAFLPTCLADGGPGPIPLSRCLDYRTRAPDRFVLGYAPDPRRAGALDKLKAAVDIYGVKVCGELKLRMMYDNPDALRMFRYCGEKGLPVVVHLDYEIPCPGAGSRESYWYGGGIDTLGRALAACPGTLFLGHAPGFWAHLSNDRQYAKTMYPKGKVRPGGRLPMLLDRHPNLHCDISATSGLRALQRDPDFARQFLVEFQDRVLFGRDLFGGEHAAFLLGLGLPRPVQRKIFRENAERLVGGD